MTTFIAIIVILFLLSLLQLILKKIYKGKCKLDSFSFIYLP